MSQAILKMANGNKVTWGSREYEFTDLENSVMNGLDNYLDDLELSNNDREEVRNYVSQYLEGFKNGTIKKRVDGAYDVSDTNLITDSNNVKRTIFGKVKGDKKKLALGFFDKAFKLMVPMVPETETSSETENTPTESTERNPFQYNLSSFLNKHAFKGGDATDAEKQMWYTSEDRWTPALRALGEYKESLVGDYDFSNTPFKDKEEYLSKLQDVETALNNKDLKALQKALYESGEADLYNYFIPTEDYLRSLVPADQLATYDAQQKAAKFDKDLADLKANAKLYNSDVNLFNYSTDSIPEGFFDNINEETISNELGSLLTNPNNYTEDGYIIGSIGYRHGFPTIWKFDPNKRTVTELPLEEVDPKLYEEWKKDPEKYMKKKPTSNKEGGIIKAQEGTSLNDLFFKNRKKSEPVSEPKSEVKETPTVNTSSSDKKEPKPTFQEYGLTGVDIARLASTFFDVVSAVSAYAPTYGTLASAGTGVLSTLVNLGADISDDNVTVGQTIGNLGTRLASDAMGLIPYFGTAAKLGKISKTLIKVAPYAIGTLSWMGASGKDIETWKKVLSGDLKSLGSEDLMVLANTIPLFTGLGKKKAATKRANEFKARHISETPTTEIYVKTPQGYLSRTPEERDLLLKSNPDAKSRIFERTYYPVNEAKSDDGKTLIIDKFSNPWFANQFALVGTGKSKYKPPRAIPRGYHVERNGGVIKAEDGTSIPGSITNTSAKDGYNRGQHFLNSQAVLDFFRTITPENYQDFNNYEDTYDTEYEKAFGEGALSNWGTYHPAKIPWKVSSVSNLQSEFNKRKGLNDVIGNWFTGVGNSGDRATTWLDGAFGDMTAERTLGRGITPEFEAEANKILNTIGLKYAQDPNKKNGWRISLLGVTPSKEEGTVQLEVPPVIPPTNVRTNLEKNGLPSIKQTIPDSTSPSTGQSSLNGVTLPSIEPNLYSLLRFGLSSIFNNNVKYKPQTVLTDAPVLYAKTSYNLPAENIYRDAANNYRELANRSMTADVEKNFGMRLAAESKANDMEAKGRLANLEQYLKTSENAQNIQNKNILYAIQNSNQNKARMVATQNAKEVFNRTKRLKQAQNVSSYLLERQRRADLNNIRRLALKEEDLRNTASVNWQEAQREASNKLLAAKADYLKKNPSGDWEKSEEYKRTIEALNREMLDTTTREQKKLLKARQALYFKTGGSLNDKLILQAAKDYNKMLLEDQREFNKLLRFSISQSNKVIQGMSKHAADLIKQSLKV